MKKVSIMMSSLLRLTWILLLHLPKSAEAHGRILAVPLPFISHVNAMLQLCDQVEHQYGYQTTVILTEQHAKHPALRKTRADVVISRGMGIVDHVKIENYVASRSFDGLSLWEFLDVFKQLRTTCENTLKDNDLFEDLGRKRFDLAIIDNALPCTCFSVIPYKLSTPFVHFGRMINPRLMRIVAHPVAYPFGLDRKATDKMTFTQRLVNVIDAIIWHIVPDEFTPNDVVGNFAPERPHLSNHELQAQTQLYLLDFDELMDFHLPAYPNMIFVGGLVTQPARALSQDVKKFVDGAENGIIVVSFGSLVKIFPDDFLKKLYHMFELFNDLRFIFKYGNTSRIENNVLFMPWIPQNDLLGHPKTRAFVTHCGNRGQFEALYHGVPMLGIPLFADQLYNSVRMKAKGYGLYLDVTRFSQEDLVHIMKEILTSSQYKSAIMKASVIFRNRPEVPSKRAAFWINHVIKYGGLHLRSEAAAIPYYQYLLLDVVSCILGLLASTVCVLCFVFKFCMRLVRAARKSKVE